MTDEKKFKPGVALLRAAVANAYSANSDFSFGCHIAIIMHAHTVRAGYCKQSWCWVD